MKEEMQLEFIVDKLTNSIQNIVTSDSFPTDVLPITIEELKAINKKRGW